MQCRERGAESGQRPQERRRSVEAAAASCSDDGCGRSPSRAAHEAHYQSNPPRQADSNNPENSFQCRSCYIFCRSQMGIGPPQFPCIFRQIVYPGVYTFETLLRHSFSHSPVRQSSCSHFFGSPNEVQPRRQLRVVCWFLCITAARRGTDGGRSGVRGKGERQGIMGRGGAAGRAIGGSSGRRGRAPARAPLRGGRGGYQTS